MKTFTLFAVLFLAALAWARVTADETARLLDASTARDHLLSLVAERLEQMPRVAAAKWRDGKAVSDPTREQALLATLAKDAAARGLQADGVAALFTLQMRLAREAQERAFGHWRAEGCTDCAAAPALAALRQVLDGIGGAQLDALYLLAPLDRDEDPPRLSAALQSRLEALIPDAASRAELLQLIDAIGLQSTPGLARARANGVLRFGVPGDYAPFALQQAGALSGADIALAQALAATLGLEPVFLRSSWPGLAQDLQRDAFDIAIGGVSVTPERARIGRFSRVYREGGKTLLARCTDRARFNSAEAVNAPNVRLIVNRGGTNESVARALLPRASLRVYPDNIGVFAEVAEGRADVMLTDDVEAELKSRQDPRLCRSFAGTLQHVGKALWMTPDTALVEAVDGWLGKAMASGDTQRWMDEAMRAAAEAAPHQN
jgi:cyclohexadienyl dehydratase